MFTVNTGKHLKKAIKRHSGLSVNKNAALNIVPGDRLPGRNIIRYQRSGTLIFFVLKHFRSFYRITMSESQ
jgi:hypothetical protein